MKESYSARFADLLVDIAAKVRAMTADRAERALVIVSLGLLPLLLLGVMMLLLGIGLFRLLSDLTNVTSAYAIIGGLLVVVGWLLWRKSRRVPGNEVAAADQ